ncbi:MAG: DNA polymerase III subunit beta [Opitutae bacterium]|nr:DNA polymerase III subunit beta [Opitutae bacterium]MCD8299262.1 DNA polymerase III subunit beta [Opitutae bacterium]
MKFKVNRDHLVNGLSQVVNVTSSNPRSLPATLPVPVGDKALIEAAEDFVSLSATGMDLRISCRVKADVSSPGKIMLPAKWLKNVVGGFRNLDVFFEVQGENRVKINSGSSKFNAVAMSAVDFPMEPSFDSAFSIELDKSCLLRIIRLVSYAQSTDENRYILNGIFFNFAEDELTVVATDGRRLAKSVCKLENNIESAMNFILPSSAVIELQKLLVGEGKVHLEIGERQVSFDIDSESEETGIVGKIKVVSKLIEGKYPQYQGVIPKDPGNKVGIEREELLSAIMQVRKAGIDSVILSLSENIMELTASSDEYGDSSDKIAIKYVGNDVKIAFNPDFVIDILKALTQDSIMFEFKDDLSPGVFKTKDETFLCVVMPLRK